jgi:hypothetical protein
MHHHRRGNALMRHSARTMVSSAVANMIIGAIIQLTSGGEMGKDCESGGSQHTSCGATGAGADTMSTHGQRGEDQHQGNVRASSGVGVVAGHCDGAAVDCASPYSHADPLVISGSHEDVVARMRVCADRLFVDGNGSASGFFDKVR